MPTRRRSASPGTYVVARVRGIAIEVNASWLIMLAVLAVVLHDLVLSVEPGLGSWSYAVGLGLGLLLYVTAFLHEISHALAARAFGMPVRAINLQFFGGVTEIEGEATTPGREFVIAVVGPITSIGIGAAAYLMRDVAGPGLLGLAIGWLAVTNLAVGALNLVPGLPLDGGRVAQAAVWAATRDRLRGVIVAAWGGRVAAVAVLGVPIAIDLGSYEVSLWDFIIAGLMASFLWAGATQALNVARMRRKFPALSARSLVRSTLEVPGDLPLAESLRRAQLNGAGALVVVDPEGRPEAIVSEASVAAVPDERRPWLPTMAVARTLHPGLVIGVGLVGEDLVRAMARQQSAEYVVVDGEGSLVGVLASSDVDEAFRRA